MPHALRRSETGYLMDKTSESRYHDGAYLAANPTWDEEYGDWKAARIHELWTSTGLPTPRTVAEIGCGAGSILASLRGRFPDTVTYSGFDIAADAINRAQKYAGPRLNYYCQDLTRQIRSLTRCCVSTYSNTLKSFEFLRTIRRIAPLVVFNIPLEIHVAGTLINHQLWTRRQYGHLHFYTAAVAMETLRECGFPSSGNPTSAS